MAVGPFKKAKSAHALLTCLKNMKMQREEDGFDVYLNKFQDILNSLQPEDQPNDISKCCDFVNGLEDSLQFEVRMKAPNGATWKNWTDLLEVSKTIWTALCNSGHCKKTEPKRPALEKGAPKGARSEDDKKRTGDHKPRQSKKPRQAPKGGKDSSTWEDPPKTDKDGKDISLAMIKKAREDNTCTYCHRKGHVWHKCTVLKGETPEDALPTPPPPIDPHSSVHRSPQQGEEGLTSNPLKRSLDLNESEPDEAEPVATKGWT